MLSYRWNVSNLLNVWCGFFFVYQVQVKNGDDDEGDTVTYSALKASSPSAQASDDSGTLYASISKTAK